MRLRVLSDLHVEFSDFESPSVESDVVVLAGDIGVGIVALDWVHNRFPETPVVYVLGNHEYYGNELNLAADFKSQARKNIRILNNDTTFLDGVRFLGSTLSTDFALFGAGEQFFAMQNARRGMPDFELIRDGGRQFTPQASRQIFERSRDWLARELSKPFDGKTVVVTHHAPSTMSVAPRFKMDPMSPAFASRLEQLIEEYQPALWIHGHTHDAFDYKLFGTRVVCNPRGYPEEVGRQGFDPALVLDLD